MNLKDIAREHEAPVAREDMVAKLLGLIAERGGSVQAPSSLPQAATVGASAGAGAAAAGESDRMCGAEPLGGGVEREVWVLWLGCGHLCVWMHQPAFVCSHGASVFILRGDCGGHGPHLRAFRPTFCPHSMRQCLRARALPSPPPSPSVPADHLPPVLCPAVAFTDAPALRRVVVACSNIGW